jgi:hypothetical protein
MVSSDVRFAPVQGVSAVGVRSGSAGIASTAVQAAMIDRLEWDRDAAHVVVSGAGRVDPAPIATARTSTLHAAADAAGFPCLVRRCSPMLAAEFARGHRVAAQHLDGAAAPNLLGVDGTDVWFDRLAWQPAGQPPRSADVDSYVTGLVRQVLEAGVLVGTGTVHISRWGGLICEDIVVAGIFEVDQRALLRSIVLGLVAADPVAVADAAAAFCGGRPPRLGLAAASVVLSLQAQWTAVAFGLAIYGLGRAVLAAGVASEPLVLLGDELLHRLDLAHEHRLPVPGLATPTGVAELVNPAGNRQ